MIRAQGGDPDAPLPTARETQVVAAPADGVLVGLDAYAVGRRGVAARRRPGPQGGPGAGRRPASRCTPSPAPTVRGGEPLFTLHTDEPDRFADAEEALAGAVVIAPEGSRPDVPPLVLDRVG